MLLDVQMPEMDGFEVIGALAGGPPGRRPLPAVIFVTALDRYALRAFEVHALDYLLKPVTVNGSPAPSHRARTRDRRAAGRLPSIRAFWRCSTTSPRAAASSRGFRCKSGGRGHRLVARGRGLDSSRRQLRDAARRGRSVRRAGDDGRLERELDPERFVRIHRSAIVQVDRIKELLPDFHGDFTVVLRNGARVTLSRTYRAKVEAVLGAL